MPSGNELFFEIDHIDKQGRELKKEFQYFGCPFCNKTGGEIIDNTQTRQLLFFKLKRCQHCYLIYAYPRPNKNLIEGFFSGERLPLKVTPPRPASWIKKVFRKTSLNYSYQEFLKYARKGDRVLDIGAGTGIVTKKLLDMGCQVEAVEFNPQRAEFLRKNLGIKVHQMRLEDFKATQLYDRIVLSQVLMHFFSVGDALKKIKSLLKPGGIFVCSLTNFDSIVQMSVRSPFPGRGLTPFTIVSWFTVENAYKMFPIAGFKVKEIIHRPEGLLGYLFLEGFPGGIRGSILLAVDQIIKIILVGLGKTSYFAVITENA